MLVLVVWDTFDVKLEESWEQLAWTIAGLVYPVWLFSHAVGLRLDWAETLTQIAELLVDRGVAWHRMGYRFPGLLHRARDWGKRPWRRRSLLKRRGKAPSADSWALLV